MHQCVSNCGAPGRHYSDAGPGNWLHVACSQHIRRRTVAPTSVLIEGRWSIASPTVVCVRKEHRCRKPAKAIVECFDRISSKDGTFGHQHSCTRFESTESTKMATTRTQEGTHPHSHVTEIFGNLVTFRALDHPTIPAGRMSSVKLLDRLPVRIPFLIFVAPGRAARTRMRAL